MLKFSRANTKLQHLKNVKNLKPYLAERKGIFSLDLLSGWSCPHAKDCLAKVYESESGGLKLVDGPHTLFRCFSASQEVFFTKAYEARKHNLELLREATRIGTEAATRLLNDSLPKNAGIIRIHVAGDFFNKKYFEAWLEVARLNPDRLFYAYTKSLKFWVDNLDRIPYNFILTASRGGRLDGLIDEYGLREAKVIFSESQADGPIDKDDSHAADPKLAKKSFCLLLHGIQPAGSEAAVALRKLNGKGSYSRRTNGRTNISNSRNNMVTLGNKKGVKNMK